MGCQETPYFGLPYMQMTKLLHEIGKLLFIKKTTVICMTTQLFATSISGSMSTVHPYKKNVTNIIRHGKQCRDIQ